MGKLEKKPLEEPIFKYYKWYPHDEDGYKRVLVAFLPIDMADAFRKHKEVSEEFALDYLDKVLAEYGYSDEDIFYYLENERCAEVIEDEPDKGDLLVEDDIDGL